LLMAKLPVRCIPYMDDWVVLAPTRWKQRAAVRLVNQALAKLRLKKHPQKTFVGRAARGFDFLGYCFTAAGLSLAAATKQRFVERATRLYEQGAAPSRIGQYVRHWLAWVMSGGLGHLVDALVVEVACSKVLPAFRLKKVSSVDPVDR
jgi:hypothetical protein